MKNKYLIDNQLIYYYWINEYITVYCNMTKTDDGTIMEISHAYIYLPSSTKPYLFVTSNTTFVNILNGILNILNDEIEYYSLAHYLNNETVNNALTRLNNDIDSVVKFSQKLGININIDSGEVVPSCNCSDK